MLADLVRKRYAEVAVGPWAPLDVRVAVNVTSQNLSLQLLIAAQAILSVCDTYEKSAAYQATAQHRLYHHTVPEWSKLHAPCD